MLIKAYPLQDNKNNKKLIKDIINYQKKFPCCSDFPTCTHPILQTDPQLHHHFPEFGSSYFKNLKKYLKDSQSSTNDIEYRVLEFKMWALISLANDKPAPAWHHHAKFKDNPLEISSLLYLTDTKIGTMFDVKYLKIYLKPQLNTWFFWPSDLLHCPETTQINKKTRITIATAIVLKEKGPKFT